MEGKQDVLMVNNTIAQGKVPFFAQPGKGNVITWYSCGPTVYDSSHMGHARTYIAIDIIRRIMEDYFNYNILSVMNVTDIDDKIILKARRGYLVRRYVERSPATSSADFSAAWTEQLERMNAKIADVDAAQASGEMKSGEAASLRELYGKEVKKAESALSAISAASGKLSAAELVAMEGAFDTMGVYLDAKEGGSLTPEEIMRICKEHSSRYEREFFEDMDMLRVRPPEVLTRVTEYVDKVIAFIAKIVENGFGYASNGSVYFDTAAFAAHPDHTYGRLKPNATNVTAEKKEESAAPEGAGAVENDGELGAATAGEKRCKADFALWKRSKPGEPSWPSPWGPGRPGWHIECSCMSSDICGETLDIHFGGQDLKFPHHENELAQSEAYHGCKQWVRYFLHSGHLDIDGLKMSKSLKNFITIRQAFEKGYTARQLRTMVLLASWDRTMNFSADTMEHAKRADRRFSEFFLSVRGLLRAGPATAGAQAWGERERALRAVLEKTQIGVHAALLDNFDTPTVMRLLDELVAATNDYTKGGEVRAMLVSQIAQYVTRILRVFGLVNGNDDIGFGPEAADGAGEGREAVLAPVLDSWAKFRTDVRVRARDIKDAQILGICDRVRDEDMPKLGVRLEDDGLIPWKLTTPEEAMRLVAEKKEKERAVALRKLEGRKRAAETELAQWTKFAPEPDTMFRTGEFTIPADGARIEEVPKLDAEGKELAKKRRDKLNKQFEAAKKGHEKYLKAVEANPNLVKDLEKKIADLNAELEKLKN